MTEPTKKQIKKFWEWCGFSQNNTYGTGEFYNYPNGGSALLPELDLNNIFKWAVPKLGDIEIEKRGNLYECWIYENRCIATISGFAEGDDPALALFWAIYELIEVKDARTE